MNRSVLYKAPALIFFLALRLTQVSAQPYQRTLPSNTIAIDQVPVVVIDLDQIKKILSETLQFKVKVAPPTKALKTVS